MMSMPGTPHTQGREKVLAALREDAERTAAIEAAVRDVLRVSASQDGPW